MTTNKQAEVTVIIVRDNIGYNMYFLTKDEANPLGSLAGKGRLSGQKGGKIEI